MVRRIGSWDEDGMTKRGPLDQSPFEEPRFERLPDPYPSGVVAVLCVAAFAVAFGVGCILLGIALAGG